MKRDYIVDRDEYKDEPWLYKSVKTALQDIIPLTTAPDALYSTLFIPHSFAISKMTPPKAIALSLLLLSSWASASAIPVQARAAASSSAVASASSAQATCGWTYFLNVDNSTTDDDDADDGEVDSSTTTSKRDEHELHQLARRGRTTNSYNNGKCALGTKIFKPQYPGPATLESMQGSAFLGYYIPKLDQCPAGAVTYDVISDSSVLTDTVAAYWDSANAGTGQKYIALGAKVSPTDSYINVDHVCKCPWAGRSTLSTVQ